MSSATNLTFVVPVARRDEVLQDNFLGSPCVRAGHSHQLLIQENFSSAAAAYNDAIDHSKNDLMVFVHQDVVLPEAWFGQLQAALHWLEMRDSNWGVLGAYGVRQDGGESGYIYSNGQGMIGRRFHEPEPVQTLDEIVLILRKSSGLRFDDELPHFHFYGTDICLAAARRRMANYAIPTFCIHNTHRILALPPEFYECYRRIKKHWRQFLPVQTTCIRVTRFDKFMYKRRAHDAYQRYVRHSEFSNRRVRDVHQLLQEVDALLREPVPAASASGDSPHWR